MLSPFVVCDVGPGLRESEVQVAVHDLAGRKHRLRVEANFLRPAGGTSYLPVGIIEEDPAEDRMLIEFPHEADSGANRIWVSRDQLLKEVHPE